MNTCNHVNHVIHFGKKRKSRDWTEKKESKGENRRRMGGHDVGEKHDEEMLEVQFYPFLKRFEAETNMKTLDALIKTDSKELIIDYIAFFISKPV